MYICLGTPFIGWGDTGTFPTGRDWKRSQRPHPTKNRRKAIKQTERWPTGNPLSGLGLGE